MCVCVNLYACPFYTLTHDKLLCCSVILLLIILILFSALGGVHAIISMAMMYGVTVASCILVASLTSHRTACSLLLFTKLDTILY